MICILKSLLQGKSLQIPVLAVVIKNMDELRPKNLQIPVFGSRN